ncbi:magnesium transporter CorA family protein [Frigidibacter oleivorans]|uniref:magnesium transporter CorA family protein n=1 Tax=Frigidibacter oleivorans TaxID=2487129 RepID=UPI000F8E58D1|nr:magnesium transporter CorA family protein [Frigidibacter oleivorans]
MLFAYQPGPRGLMRLGQGASLTEALWIDIYRPLDNQVQALAALGIEVPTLADMEEIEISNRLYREDAVDYITVVLPGLTPARVQVSGPVTFILSPGRLVTVRHHAPRPFETFPDRADKAVAGCSDPDRIFLGLIEEIVSRQADLLEQVGRVLDGISTDIFSPGEARPPEALQKMLELVGQQGEMIGRVRLALLTLERALTFYGTGAAGRVGDALKGFVKNELRDIQALAVHADFLSARVALAVDAVLGMINLAQNTTVRIVSVVAALFLPPTLIASLYGMNFAVMPELQWRFGYPMALGMMLGSAVATYLFFKWKKWL